MFQLQNNEFQNHVEIKRNIISILVIKRAVAWNWRSWIKMPALSLINPVILDSIFYSLWVSVSSSGKWIWSLTYMVILRIQWDIADEMVGTALDALSAASSVVVTFTVLYIHSF